MNQQQAPWPKVLWVDDDKDVLQSAERLFRQQPWTLVAVNSAEDARERLSQQSAGNVFAVVVADHRLQAASGLDVLEFAKNQSPLTTRILLTGRVEMSVIEEAVNRGHVFRFIAKPWDNEQLLVDIAKAIEHHRLKLTEAGLRKELSLGNSHLEQLTSGLGEIVAERTATEEASKLEVENQMSRLRVLVRFIKGLASLTEVEDLLVLIQKEVKSFHEVRTPMLGYIESERRPKIVFFQGKGVVQKEARSMWWNRSKLRQNQIEDQQYLANEFGRPFGKVLAVPLSRSAVATNQDSIAPATLFFEHGLTDEALQGFIEFISERLQPLSIALDRILLESHLLYTSRQWESTFDGIKDPIAIVDVDFQVLRSNRHFSLQGGQVRNYESSCHKLFAAQDSRCRGCPVLEVLETGLPQKGLVRRGERTFEVASYPIRPVGYSTTTTVVNHYVDVTNARELHGRMVQGEKMAAIGLLAGNIAHELNNPLTGIRSLAQVLLGELAEKRPVPEQLIEDMMEVEKAAARSQRIIENLLDFSRGGTEQKQVRISLNEIVRRTLPMLKTSIREHRSEILLSDEEGMVRVEPHLMQQVVFNLVNNACQAMHDPGQITIRTEVIVDSASRRWCNLHVIDTGTGIPQEILESIFEPFFTTKERGKGTGLGLSMSKSVIEKFGGDIQVKSEVGFGTEFVVRLPEDGA